MRRLCLSYNELEDAQRVALFRQIAELKNVEEFVFLEFISPETDVVAGYEELFRSSLRVLEVRFQRGTPAMLKALSANQWI